MGLCESKNTEIIWKWDLGEIKETYKLGLPGLNNWNNAEDIINKVISKDRIRTNIQIGSFKGYYIPPLTHNVWTDLGLKRESKVLIALSCSQLLWGSIHDRYYNPIHSDNRGKINPFTNALKQRENTNRYIQVMQGRLYEMMTFDSINMENSEINNFFRIMVKIEWSVLKGHINCCYVKIFETKNNEVEDWRNKKIIMNSAF